ncbi:MAG: AsmA-like C-terminal region-containing protein [Alphaproteobacteria bacterium]
MRTLLIVLVSAIALTFAGLAALPWLTPQDFARERLAAALQRRGHFQLEAARNIRMQVFPRPGFKAEGLVVRYTGKSEKAPSVSAERVFLTVDPLSLFSRSARVSAVEADRVGVALGNKRRSASIEDRIALDRIDLAIEHSGFGPGDPAKLTGVLKSAWLDEDVHVAATLGKVNPGTNTAPLNFRATSRDLRFVIEGKLFRSIHSNFQGKMRLDIGQSSRYELLRALRLEGDVLVNSREIALYSKTFSAPGVKGAINIVGGWHGGVVVLYDLSLYGGHANGFTTLSTKGPGNSLKMKLKLNDVDTLSLSQSISNFDWVSGKMDLSLDAKSTGNDISHILDHLNGTGSIEVKKGTIEGLDLPGVVADIRDGELRGWRRKQGRRTAFDLLSIPFRIDGGVANITHMQLSGQNIAATGKGSTNLVTHKLDLRLKARVNARDDGKAQNPPDVTGNNAENASAEPASLTVPLRIKGDWEQPKIQPDVSEALKDRKSLKKNIKLFGKSIEKITGGKVKSRDLGRLLDNFLGKNKDEDNNKEQEDEDSAAPKSSY